MNEGITSTLMGLPGRPEIAEEVQVARDIRLVEYANSFIHLTGISTQHSIKLIQEAKARRAGVSCSATPYHLFFCDEDLETYDTNLKVNPPIRHAKNRKALQKAVAGGVIDCIASHHFPYEADSKIVEFEYAKNGMIGLQTAYAVVNTAVNISQQKLVELFAVSPRKILGLTVPSITEGAAATLTLFHPKQKWMLQKENIKSLSANSPFIGKELTGKPFGIINNGQLIIN
jgi:dihydroorotase